jgi:imidazolonepropionase-like amidohydrolase
MTPIDAIQAATINAADLLGWRDRVGVLEPGYYADIVAVTGDLLSDVKVLESPIFVMKGGQIVRQESGK